MKNHAKLPKIHTKKEAKQEKGKKKTQVRVLKVYLYEIDKEARDEEYNAHRDNYSCCCNSHIEI